MRRYAQLLDIVRERQPKTILEIGTWNGVRAHDLLKASPGATYFGFDLFEDATEETDAEEMNVKRHFSVSDVRKQLNGYPARLVKGNTRETLKDFVCPPIDVAYIDGGHSVETIESDWANVQKLMSPDGVVVFDDYYSPSLPGFGCNDIVKDLPHTVLPEKDRIMDGRLVQFVKVEMTHANV